MQTETDTRKTTKEDMGMYSRENVGKKKKTVAGACQKDKQTSGHLLLQEVLHALDTERTRENILKLRYEKTKRWETNKATSAGE